MKETNERAVIQLLHAPTGEYVDWLISEQAVPSVHMINTHVEELREEMNAYMEKHDIDFEKEGTSETLSPEQIKEISRINRKIIKLKLDALSSILSPKEAIPAGYDNRREFLEQCISSQEVIPAIMDFFSRHSGNSTGLQEDSPPPIRILDRNGEEWESPISKALHKSRNSTG